MLMLQIKDMKLRILQIISLFAHNSHNYQNHRSTSLVLGTVVEIGFLAFVVLFLRCCCSPVVEYGCY